jgi:hypothetical protein
MKWFIKTESVSVFTWLLSAVLADCACGKVTAVDELGTRGRTFSVGITDAFFGSLVLVKGSTCSLGMWLLLFAACTPVVARDQTPSVRSAIPPPK